MNKNRILKKWVIIAALCALIAFVIPLVTMSYMAKDDRDIVIVRDPGHGGADVGAVSSDHRLYEADLNLAIALACRDELERYDGVKVYMTHTGIDYNSTLSLNSRINYVYEVDGDILISLHCNDSDNLEANGSEIYVSHSTYSERYYQQSTELAIGILKKFSDLGMRIRGVKTRLSNGSRMYYHDDGSVEVGDYYAVIGGTIKKYGIPGILVEHGFVTGDEAFLSDAGNLRALGIADATAIAEYYGLQLAGTKPADEEDMSGEKEAVIITDADAVSASDVANRLMAIDSISYPEYFDDLQKLRVDYERLSPAAKTLIDPAYVENLYKTIITVDEQVHPLRLALRDSSELDINRINHVISGVDTARGELNGTTAAELSAALVTYVEPDAVTSSGDLYSDAGSFIIVVGENGERLDIGERIGTGTRVQLWQYGLLCDQLTVVIKCDISGDGIIDSHDQYLLEDYLYNGLPLGQASLLAADANNDGYVNEDDIEDVVHAIFLQEQS